MAKIMKPGMWKRRDGKVVSASCRRPSGLWECSDGLLRFDEGCYWLHRDSAFDLVEFLGSDAR